MEASKNGLCITQCIFLVNLGMPCILNPSKPSFTVFKALSGLRQSEVANNPKSPEVNNDKSIAS